MTHDPELVPYQQAIRRHVLEQLERTLAQAVAHGDTWPDLDVEAAALAIFSLLDTLSLRRGASSSGRAVFSGASSVVRRADCPPRRAGYLRPRARPGRGS